MDQNDWIKELLNEEHERRQTVKAFTAAIPSFVHTLVNHMNEALKVYESQIHTPHFTVQVLPNNTVTIQSSGIGSRSENAASVELNASRQELSIHFEKFGTRKERLQVSDGFLSIPGANPAFTFERLTRQILVPVLFPELDRSITDRYIG